MPTSQTTSADWSASSYDTMVGFTGNKSSDSDRDSQGIIMFYQ